MTKKINTQDKLYGTRLQVTFQNKETGVSQNHEMYFWGKGHADEALKFYKAKVKETKTHLPTSHFYEPQVRTEAEANAAA